MNMSEHTAVIDDTTLAEVEARLGRKPRGLREVAVVDSAGQPAVIRVASLVNGKPFPTLFWLIDPALNLRIDREEATGRIAAFQSEIDAQPALQRAMADDHQRHIQLRESYLQREEKELLERQGQWSALAERGIGGIADFSRIRCLHTWYAAHLVEPNTVGQLLDSYWGEIAENPSM